MTVARLSDHILVPLQSGFPDLAAIIKTIDIAELTKTPETIVLNLALVNYPRASSDVSRASKWSWK